MKRLLPGFLLVFLLLVFTSFLRAQVIEDGDSLKDSRYVLVELFNGQEFMGVLVEQDINQLTLKLETGGVMTIPIDQIQNISFVKKRGDFQDGTDLFYHNLQATRYFFGPNGFGLKQGEGYYQNTWIFVNQASVGITDNFTLGVGVVPLFLFAGTASPVWITPKFSIPVKEDVLNVGAGGLFGTIVGEEGTFFGIAYGAVTIGNRDHNLNISVGYGMIEGDWSQDPTLTLSGMTRVGRKFYLITENYLLPGFEFGLLSFGGRSLFPKISMDYGLVFPTGSGEFVGIPWLGITVPFTSKR